MAPRDPHSLGKDRLDSGFRDAGGFGHPLQLIRGEGGTDRSDGVEVDHVGSSRHSTGDRGEEQTGARSAEIADHAAQASGRVEISKDRGRCLFLEVVEEQTADHDVGGGEPALHRIHLVGLDLQAGFASSLSTASQGVLADVGDLPLDAVSTAREALGESNHQVPAASGHVEDRDPAIVLGKQLEDRSPEGEIGQGPGIQPSQSIQRGVMIGRGKGGVVHELGLEQSRERGHEAAW